MTSSSALRWRSVAGNESLNTNRSANVRSDRGPQSYIIHPDSVTTQQEMHHRISSLRLTVRLLWSMIMADWVLKLALSWYIDQLHTSKVNQYIGVQIQLTKAYSLLTARSRQSNFISKSARLISFLLRYARKDLYNNKRTLKCMPLPQSTIHVVTY